MTTFYSEDSNMHQIIPYIYQGDFMAKTKPTLIAYDIKHIVNCASKDYKNLPDWSGTQFGLPWDDDEDQQLFPEIMDAYHVIKNGVDSKEGVLIHCAMGISRSTSVTMFYLIKTYNITAETALSMIQSKRSWAKPNPSFLRQLQAYCTEQGITSTTPPVINVPRYDDD